MAMNSAEVSLDPANKLAPTSVPLLDKDAHVPQCWPISPKTTKAPLYVRLWNIVVDLILLLLSVAFLAFALIVNKYDHAPIAENPIATERLLAAIKYGPTVFPILFATVLGRAAHAILIWRLERGELIGTLDVLAGSTSLTSTVTSQFQLRRITFLGAVLAIIWALSPIGGQGTIRQLTLGESLKVTPASFNYASPNGNLFIFGGSDKLVYVSIANTLFNAAIVGPSSTKTSPRDLWGNVKIPMIETYEKDHPTGSDFEGWFETSEKPQDYASLVGIPVSGIERGFVNYSFNIDTTYLHLDCSLVPKEYFGYPSGSSNSSGQNAHIYWSGDLANRTGPMSNNRSSTRPADLKPFVFTYGPRMANNGSQCSIKSTYVEVGILCQDHLTCGVSKIRRSRKEHFPEAYTPLDMNSRDFRWSTWQYFSLGFLTSVSSRPGFGSLIDGYMHRPSNPADPSLSKLHSNLTGAEYGHSLSQLFNSYWACLNNVFATSGGVTNGTAYLETKSSFVSIEPLASLDLALKARVWPSEGTRATATQVMIAHKGWIAALAIASSVLILASLVSPIVRCFLIEGPDILMNISSLATRNNPLIPLPGNGTYMDASDRSKLLKDVRLRFGDVDKSAETGNLAIGALEDRGSVHIGRIQRGRLYE